MARKKKSKEIEITINGYLEEIELEDGTTGVLINDGENDYYLVMDKIGTKLLDHIDEEIEATGMVSAKRGELILRVIRYHMVDEYEDMYDDELEEYWDE